METFADLKQEAISDLHVTITEDTVQEYRE